MNEKLGETAAIFVANGIDVTISKVEAAIRQSSEHAKNLSHGDVSRFYFAQQEKDLVQTLGEIKQFRRAVMRMAFPPLSQEKETET
jgi:hypothetical protein